MISYDFDESCYTEGWNACLDSIRASLREYPNGGGDKEVMDLIEQIMAKKLEELDVRPDC